MMFGWIFGWNLIATSFDVFGHLNDNIDLITHQLDYTQLLIDQQGHSYDFLSREKVAH